jgi:hypothetical protein
VFVELQPQETRTKSSNTRAWQAVRPEESTHLSDSRLQLHHAAQFGAAAGISFLEHRPDDSHTNLEWVPTFSGLASRVIPGRKPFRIGVRPADLTLLIVTEKDQPIARYRLHGRTIVEATQWIREQLGSLGADAARYSLKRHYEIPEHPVAMGDSFDASERSTSRRSFPLHPSGLSESGSSPAMTITPSLTSTSACIRTRPRRRLGHGHSGDAVRGTPAAGWEQF